MKVGDYVRTKSGKLFKVTDTKEDIILDNQYSLFSIIRLQGEVKSSSKIIDLIEVGDYVNGVLVESIYQREKDKLYIHSFDTEIMICVTNNNIETIVTKEQFEVMQYKVGE